MRKDRMLIAIISAFVTAMLLSSCTTVKTFDGSGNVTGKCRVVGFPFIVNGRCDGSANGSHL